MIDRSQVIRARVIAVIDEIAALMTEGQGQKNPAWKPYDANTYNPYISADDDLKPEPSFLNLNKDVSHLWDILSALRGPDEDRANALKTLTTAKIRSAIGIPSNRLVEVNPAPLTSTRLPYDTTKDHSGHFLLHFDNAVTALQELGYIPKEEKIHDETDRS